MIAITRTGYRSAPNFRRIGSVLSAVVFFGGTSLAVAQSADSVRVPERRVVAGSALQPASWSTRLDYATSAVSVEIALSEVEDAEVAELDATTPGIPLQIGIARAVPESHQGNIAEGAVWTLLANGNQVTSFSIRSPGAGEVRAAIQAELPPGSHIRFFGGKAGEAYPLYAVQDVRERGADELTGNAQDGVLWSPIMDGEQVGVEIEIPASAQPADVALGFVRLSHIPTSIRAKSGATSASDECSLIDAVCSAELPECQRAAVAKVIYSKGDGRSFVCSGTGLNTHRSESENFSDPYLLTAHHCIDSQSTADSLETDWHYEHDACEGSVIDSKRRTLQRGAILLATDPSSDMSLVELRDPLPNGVCLSGWSVNEAGSQSAGSDVLSVHHPDGRPKKYSRGQVEGYRAERIDSYVIDSLVINWTEGLTLGGSSGGGLFTFADEQYRLIGALSGGPTDQSCPTSASYGRLDTFWLNHAQPYLSDDEPIEDDHGGSPQSARGVVLGSSVSGSIENRADRDVFRVEVTESGLLRIFTTGEANTVGRLYGDGHDLLSADALGGYLSNFMVLAYVEKGTYYITVSGFDPDVTGDYELHVDFTASSEAPTAEVPLFLSANPQRHGFLRIFNASDSAGRVEITAFDDDGARHGPVSIALDGQETLHVNAMDLENGNAAKGLTGSLGSGSGDWRLRFTTDLALEVGAFARTSDGFVTAMHDVAYLYSSVGQHFIPIFNPGSNNRQQSKLRLINPDGARSLKVTVLAQDDSGSLSASRIELTLPPRSARTYTAAQLEAGHSDFTGRLGDGSGKWKLWVEAESRIIVMSLLETPTGHLTNLSSPGHIIP